MKQQIKKKESFGSSAIDHFNPPQGPDASKAINITISFEEALKLHLGIGQLLGHLNGYNRATAQGKRTALGLCVYTQQKRVAVYEAKLVK